MAGFVDIYRMAMGWWSKPAQTGGGWCEAMDIFVPGADDMATFHPGADQASIFVPGADDMATFHPGADQASIFVPGADQMEIT